MSGIYTLIGGKISIFFAIYSSLKVNGLRYPQKTLAAGRSPRSSG
jgi:hypothetical protein